MSKISYLIKRLLLMVVTLFGITFITFIVMNLAPGDPLQMKFMFAEGMNPDQLAQLQQSKKPVIVLPNWYKDFAFEVSHSVHGKHELKEWFLDGEPLAIVRRMFGNRQIDKILEDRPTYTVLTWTAEKSVFYKRWLTNLLHLKFGLSDKDKKPVLTKIAEALPYTLVINIITISIVYFVSIPLGMWSALRKESWMDKALMIKLFVFYSLPTFWVATMLLVFFAGGEYFNLFPLQGFQSDYFLEKTFSQKIFDFTWYLDIGWHLFLPVLASVIGSFAFLTRFSRNNFLDVLKQDYIRTARAKGLSENMVLYKHVLRNSLIPFVTLMGTLLPALLGGSVIIEQIFSIPGMGMLAFESVLGRDKNVIMGIATIGAVLTLVSLFLTDIVYLLVDPRIRFEK